jgi:hypothetical protein
VTEGGGTCSACGTTLDRGTAICHVCGANQGLSAVAEELPDPARQPTVVHTSQPPSPSRSYVQSSPATGVTQPASALAEFRITTMTAGVVAVVMLLIEIGIRSPFLFVGWFFSNIFVAWRCFVSVPHALNERDYTVARRMLLLPAALNIVTLTILPGALMLVGFFRSSGRKLNR